MGAGGKSKVNLYDSAALLDVDPGDSTNRAVRVNIIAGGGTLGGAVTEADGANVTQGVTTGTAVTSDATGTIHDYIRGLVKILASVWSSVNSWLSMNVAAWGGTATTLGQKVSASSVPVVVASDQSAVSVTFPAGTSVELLDSGGTNKASISAAGAVKVDGSAVTQPVSGTVTANQGGAPWSVTFPSAQSVTIPTPVPVTQNVTPWAVQQVDEQGNKTQDSELYSMFREILMELKAIRIGLQLWTQEDIDFIDAASEQTEGTVVN